MDLKCDVCNETRTGCVGFGCGLKSATKCAEHYDQLTKTKKQWMCRDCIPKHTCIFAKCEKMRIKCISCYKLIHWCNTHDYNGIKCNECTEQSYLSGENPIYPKEVNF